MPLPLWYLASAAGFAGTYETVRSQLPGGPASAMLAGSLAGAATRFLTPDPRIVFPEIKAEIPYQWPPQDAVQRVKRGLKGPAGGAIFFTIFEGLTLAVESQRKNEAKREYDAERLETSSAVATPPFVWHTPNDAQTHVTNALAGGVSGLALRAATFPLHNGLQNPVLSPMGPKLMGQTFLVGSALMLAVGWLRCVYHEFMDAPGPSDV
ncbi:hypothetical protein CXG81DRAFT_26416 [Caulochytrium protostelioides]|uniref:Uncharacterized protein n=1 Tax=Caulochytrium protostelioides TaxID=1555241 RepID=A0A4P9WX77_9FUNG|nr:hypothetical protein CAUPRSCDRAFT_11215 [Caulochytrium protostelioides]RKP00877.1 hypothetical protein CXG81DRAFT_26416 [Caulochytrium protostelioides]|eukprot:RKP00877.1 hypothetical protein CXG81DRAFT_26416 [Caulochytrium protostelioides]